MALDLTQLFQPGDSLEKTYLVEEKHSAFHIGSGDVKVFSTPSMIGAMEGTAHQLLAAKLPDTHSTVGVVVNIRHLAPTPMGREVHVRAEVTAVKGMMVDFNVTAWDDVEPVGDGSHRRAVIDVERFNKRIQSKEQA